MSVSECVALGTFYWDGGSLYPVLPLKITHGSAFPNMWTVDQGFNCMRMMKLDQASDPPAGCEGASYAQICVITYGGPGIGQSISKPAFYDKLNKDNKEITFFQLQRIMYLEKWHVVPFQLLHPAP